MDEKGNPVQFRDGPAAVTGDERCMQATVCSADGKAQQVE